MTQSQFSNASNRQRMKGSLGGWDDEGGSQREVWGTGNGEGTN